MSFDRRPNDDIGKSERRSGNVATCSTERRMDEFELNPRIDVAYMCIDCYRRNVRCGRRVADMPSMLLLLLLLCWFVAMLVMSADVALSTRVRSSGKINTTRTTTGRPNDRPPD